MPKVTLNTLHKAKQNGEKIACLTCYDASFAKLLNQAAIDVLLVGDTLGMVFQGQNTTIPVGIDDVVYHTDCVARGNTEALLISDLPFMTYDTPQKAATHASQLMQAGAHMVKLEGGTWVTDSIKHLSDCGIAVCSHIGLSPQSVHKLGGYRVQGRSQEQADQLMHDAEQLQAAGTELLVLECIPTALAEAITRELRIPTIGIGAGQKTDGQILVLYDILGLSIGRIPSFAKNFIAGNEQGLLGAVKMYVQQVKHGDFPSADYAFD